MSDITTLFDYFKGSQLISIGYSSETEHIKDKLLSKLPTVRVDKHISNDFTIKPYIRDNIIDQVLEDTDEAKFILIDGGGLFNNATEIRFLFERIKKELIGSKFKLILTNHLNRDTKDTQKHYSYSTIATLVYFDLSFILSPNGKELNIIKNRYGNRDENMSLEGLDNTEYVF